MTEEAMYEHTVRKLYGRGTDDIDRMARAGWELTHKTDQSHHFRRLRAGSQPETTVEDAEPPPEAVVRAQLTAQAKAAYRAWMAEEKASKSPDAGALRRRRVEQGHAKLQAHGKLPTPGLICPHCGERGHVTSKEVSQKAGISGGKATVAILTGGFSLLVPGVGLSRKVKATARHCTNCGSDWIIV